jgi:hypothetical protein
MGELNIYEIFVRRHEKESPFGIFKNKGIILKSSRNIVDVAFIHLAQKKDQVLGIFEDHVSLGTINMVE